MFGYDENMSGCNGCDVSECEDFFVFVDDVGGDLFADEFVEDGLFCHKIRIILNELKCHHKCEVYVNLLLWLFVNVHDENT